MGFREEVCNLRLAKCKELLEPNTDKIVELVKSLIVRTIKRNPVPDEIRVFVDDCVLFKELLQEKQAEIHGSCNEDKVRYLAHALKVVLEDKLRLIINVENCAYTDVAIDESTGTPNETCLLIKI